MGNIVIRASCQLYGYLTSCGWMLKGISVLSYQKTKYHESTDTLNQNFGHFTEILGYHKRFQIVDYTMANTHNISLAKMVDFVPQSNF